MMMAGTIAAGARGIVAYVLLAFGSPPPLSGASTATVTPARPASEAERPARVLFLRAEANFQVGRFPEALADYRAAYQVEPLPGFLFNIGQCYRNLHDYERARFFYRRYVALDPRSPNREIADALITDMTRLIAEQRAAEPHVVAAVDAESAARNAAPRPLALTVARTSVARKPEPAPLVTASGGDRPSSGHDASGAFYRRWWFWTGVGAVVAGGAVSAFLLTRGGPEGTLHPINAGNGNGNGMN